MPDAGSWAAALEAGGVMAFEVDLMTGAMTFSAPPKERLGFAVHDVASFAAHVRDADRALLIESLSHPRAGAGRLAIELQLQPPAGTTWISLVGASDPGPDHGGAVTHIRGVCSDITDRKRLEASLQESQSRFRDFAEISSDWLWETDENHLFTRLIGAPETNRPTAIGHTRWSFAGADPATPMWRKHVEDLEAHRDFRNFEYQVQVPTSGEVFVLSVSGRPFYDEHGRFRGYRGSTSDLTEQRALEAHLERISKLETVGHVTGGIAHDFNNLLTIIAGNAEILADDLEAEPELSGRADLVLDAARRGAELINRLMTFALRQPLEPAAVSVNSVVEGMAGMLRHALGEQVTLRMRLAVPLPPAWVDAALLERALLNLAVNARDAMPRGGILTIMSCAFRVRERSVEIDPGDYVELAVSDTGTGMEPEVLRQVLDPFFTTKEAGKGWGLGLSTVYGFAKQSGGRLAIASEPGRGTTVRIALPQAEPAARPDGRARKSGQPALGAERILVVEDEANVRRFAEALLGRLGYSTMAAADGPEALAILRSGERFDLMFTDMVLPRHMNGVELAHEARKLQPGLRVLFTSGYSQETVDRQGPRGDAPLVRKPYLRHELAAVLRRVLDPAVARV